MKRLERIAAAASRMGISRPQLYREIRAGRIGPLVKAGERISTLPSEAVDRWIDARIAEASGGVHTFAQPQPA